MLKIIIGINKKTKRYLYFDEMIKKGADVANIVSNESKYVPPIDANWINESLKDSDVPVKFQGNPVKKKLRNHSKITINVANEI